MDPNADYSRRFVHQRKPLLVSSPTVAGERADNDTIADTIADVSAHAYSQSIADKLAAYGLTIAYKPTAASVRATDVHAPSRLTAAND